MVGYSRLIRADEEGTIAALKALRTDLIDPKIDEHHGCIVKLMGDGMLAEFPSVVDAVRAADNEVPGVPDAVARVRSYHQRTKHLPGHFAPGPEYLDWANQPDPFRRVSGARSIELSLVPDDRTPSYESLFHSKATPPRCPSAGRVKCDTYAAVTGAALRELIRC